MKSVVDIFCNSRLRCIVFVAVTVIFQSSTSAEDTSGITAIEEITVTARKRSETLQDVPVSVSVLTGDTIEKLDIEDIEDTYGAIPGLYFTSNFLSPNRDFRQLVIRGVGANSQLEPSTATFIDGVYSPSLAFDLDFMDLERIEVLKGPQGALFGRNTEGGALNIVTRKPDEEFRGKLSAMYDEFNTFQVAGTVSGAISDENRLYGKFSALYHETDGFINNNAAVATDSSDVLNNLTAVPIPRAFDHSSIARKDQDKGEKKAFAGALRWVASSSLEFNTTFDYSDYEGGDQTPGPLASAGKSYAVNADSLFDHDNETYGFSLTMDWTTPIGVLTSITGWRRLTASTPWDFDGVATLNGSPRVGNVHDFDSEQRIFSEEIRLASTDDSPLTWLAGAYYFDEMNNSDRFYNFPNLDDPSGAPPQEFLDMLWNEQIVNIDRKGGAVFGQASYNFNEKIEVSAGARYSYEEARVDALERYCFPFAGFTGIAVDTFCSVDQGDWTDFFTPVERRASWNDFSPMLSASYHWNDNIMTYATWSNGFKAGSYQKAPVAVTDVEAIDPEDITNLEFGAKASFFDRRLFIDVSGYFIDLENMQLQAAIVRNGITASAIGNAAEAEVEGIELSATARPTDQITLSGNIGWTNTEFVDYQIIPDGVTVVDRSGQAFPNTPEVTFSISGEYVMPVGGHGLELVSYLSYRWIDDIYVGSDAVAVDPIIDVPSWEQLDARISLQTDKWRISLFADNLTNEYIILSRWNPFFVQPNLAAVHNRVAPPRRVGVSASYEF